MGKRELVIVAAFVLLGFAVFRFTAPPGDPSDTGFSIGRIVNGIRREVRGQQGRAEATFTSTRAVPETVSEIRLSFAIGTVTIVGEDREDIAAEMHVRSTGYDTAEAERLAKASHLVFDEAGALLIITSKFPQEGRQTPALSLKVPRRLGIRLDEKSSAFEVSNVASVLIGESRGKTTISKIPGTVTLTQRGNEVTITDVGSLDLDTFSGVEATVSRVRGDASFSLQGGELRAEELGGSLEVESRNAEMQFDRLENLTGPVRIDATLGEIVMIGLRAEARIEGRRTEIRIDHFGGAPLGVYNEGEETIELTVPPGGFTMDAISVEGDISLDATLEAAGLKRETVGPGEGDEDRAAVTEETRVTGAVRGGGPPITLRARRGDILVRSR